MVPALLLVLVFAMGLLVEAIKPMGGNAATAGEKTVDLRTDMMYEEALGSTQSTRYSGRVWADKTVYKENVDLGMEGEIDDVIRLGDDDFLIGYSLLATTTVVSGQSVVPLDVVFVIDLSLSMEEEDKIEQTVVALNQAVKTLMNGHPDTRIGVVTYSTEAEVLLPLDHYSKVEGADYFSLIVEGDTKSLYAHVIDSQGNKLEKTSQMGMWTNIHMGMDMGMDLLLQADIKTESGVARHPALMLMSDGSPTCAGSDDSSWWDPSGVGEYFGPDGTGTYTLRTIMNAAYQKQRVTEHYSSQDENLEMQVYTVGVGVDNLEEVERPLAQVTLNPKEGLASNDYFAKQVKDAWESYLAGGEPEMDGYKFTHPESGDIQSVYYNDGYFYADNAQGISDAFQQVLDKIIVTGAVPTEVDSDPAHSGYITYTDPIGEYMEVKKVKALVWNDMIYNERYLSVSEDGNITTYTFRGAMTSPIYGQYGLNEIIITVTTDPDTKNQTLEVKVPAALIPLRKNTVELNDDGTAASNDCINDKPLRLFYTVGMREDVLAADKTVDLSKIDSAYIEEHRKEDGIVEFYANRYSGKTEDQAGVEKTVGDAYISFVPADTNPFYYNQADTLLYADETCTTPAKPGASKVYIKVPYYEGTTETFDVVERSTAYNPDDIITGSDGNLYLKAGSRCNLSDRILEKGAGNLTQTAATYQYPVYTGGTDGTATGIISYMGNNGALKPLIATGGLSISNVVIGNMGEKDRAFVFDIMAYHTDGTTKSDLNGTYVGVKTSQAETTGVSTLSSPEPSLGPGEESVEFVDGKAQVMLKDGESITFRELPAGYTYVVTEQNPNTNGEGYVVTATQNGTSVSWEEGETFTCTDTIQKDQVANLDYVNEWYIPMVDFSFTKVDGLSFDSTDLDSMVTLSGAEFALYQYTGTSWETDKDVLLNPASEYAVWSQVGDIETSNGEGVVTFEDLQAGNYRLVERSAPDGYQLPDGQWNITVSISGEKYQEVGDYDTVAVENPPAFSEENGTYYLMNYKPIDPPITGSDGGEDFRIGGGLLMFTGLVLAMWWMGSSPRRRSEFF